MDSVIKKKQYTHADHENRSLSSFSKPMNAVGFSELTSQVPDLP